MPLPASHTKHLPVIHHPLPNHLSIELPVRQISSDSSSASGSTGTTGTTLWLSAQVLSAYLSSLPVPSGGKSVKVLELGGGTGFTALVLASLGYQVVSTDIEPVLSSVLGPNIDSGKRVLLGNSLPANISPRFLDWAHVDRLFKGQEDAPDDEWLKPEGGWDMLVMTDTFYAPHLIEPLWNTLIYLSTPPSSTITSKPPPIYIALESRDPILIARALETGKAKGFELKKVGKRVGKEVERWGWGKDDWEGVEVWKGRYKGWKCVSGMGGYDIRLYDLPSVRQGFI
ncbi:hypothetical protein L198_07479 [Cryptococcus wingfieldii CBS 7118]|uniref:Uncharacterized protein n=1 Tax=Cryptococcus wingfieldii CBS 7118 TaxID=1295528 RepID=A0A1E3ID34_9TREE|nr:hypothetical protein L198_07479 [Cryptococcus wingfieldii CBS 7118]ODN85651.1 hypothetical protein L198_07479 [Cryptococcus wingfieldii CBS 7118]